MLYTILPLIAFLSSRVEAHGVVTKIIAGTKTYDGYQPGKFPYMPTPPAVAGWSTPQLQDLGPINSDKVGDPDIICHRNATPGQAVAEVAAGDKVSLQWQPWPNSHKGPMLDYLADCGDDCTKVDKTQLKFFKIDGVGITNTKGTPPNFADDDMIKANNTWTVTIPASIKPGNYVLRHETIALHQAQAAGGAQMYPQCVNLKITGTGTESPTGVPGVELYKVNDPGLVFNIYKQFKANSDYTVPGPAMFSGAAAADGSPAPPAKRAADPVSEASPDLDRRHSRAFPI
ncbi:glycoside hydrolase [Microthyrium microscopicum]|uniref:AA9 family lytic polysaccharide monooxygenase n=1 Tax=Microthyrium microscopicum TaxID=703497 RepID=A0A6A6TW39_9PEZI|nr:glycoside hydrolase [Microthyrium microscopicum]